MLVSAGWLAGVAIAICHRAKGGRSYIYIHVLIQYGLLASSQVSAALALGMERHYTWSLSLLSRAIQSNPIRSDPIRSPSRIEPLYSPKKRSAGRSIHSSTHRSFDPRALSRTPVCHLSTPRGIIPYSPTPSLFLCLSLFLSFFLFPVSSTHVWPVSVSFSFGFMGHDTHTIYVHTY